MHPIKQTRLGMPGQANEPPGNCWSACIASILELPLSKVPDELDFWQPGMPPVQSWRPFEKKMHYWLFGLGYVLVECKAASLTYAGPSECYNFYNIISGPSPRNKDVLHAVVGQSQGGIVHDPHPSNAGLLEGDWTYELFVSSFIPTI